MRKFNQDIPRDYLTPRKTKAKTMMEINNARRSSRVTRSFSPIKKKDFGKAKKKKQLMKRLSKVHDTSILNYILKILAQFQIY